MTQSDFAAAQPENGGKVSPEPVAFGAVGLAHGHISMMCHGLIAAGAQLKYVYDADAKLLAQFCSAFPGVQVCASEDEVIEKQDIQLIASAAIPSHRAEIGVRVMDAGKDYFVDKAPATTLEQVADMRKACERTGRKCFIYYGESLCDSAVAYAKQVIRQGQIGQVIHVNGAAPHRLNEASRPEWFFKREYTGGILIDLVCHQIHQFLELTGTDTAAVDMGRGSNYNHGQYPNWDDFGDCALTGDNGATGYFRVDWFTPDGLKSWGDSRIFVVGTLGYLELRKNCDITREEDGCNVYLVTPQGEYRDNVRGKIKIPFFENLLADCRDRSETAMDQERGFKAIELAIEAQQMAMNKK